jgi:hypothetical protein
LKRKNPAAHRRPTVPLVVSTDIGFDPLRLSANGIRENWALSELKHGRLAMIAFLAFVVQVRVPACDRLEIHDARTQHVRVDPPPALETSSIQTKNNNQTHRLR